MTKLQSVVAAIKGKVFKLTGDKINQTERNTLKANVLDSIMSDLSAIATVTRTTDGIVLEVPNDELGSIYLELDIKVKNTDFDIDEAHTDYMSKVDAAQERVQLAAARKAKLAIEKAAKVK